MVGLSDIPCIGKAVDMISEKTVEAAFRGVRYMFCYKDLVNVLKSEIENLKIQEGSVSTIVDEEKDNGKIIEDHVSKWSEEVEELQASANEFMEKYKNRASWGCIQRVPIPKPLSRFRLGREAAQMTKTVAEHTQKGKKLLDNPIAHLAPVDNLPKTDGVSFQNFQSRKDAYDKLWTSLVTEGGPQILGIYGMPGVGKTRIAERIWGEAKEKGIFNKVIRAVVSSEELDVIRLQNDLAGHLNCHFESQDNVERRASQLKHSIINGGKVLVILDDVWKKIPLNDIGIPCGGDSSSKGCKVLFTSREKNFCRDNNCDDPVEIRALTPSEAWEMFKSLIGTSNIQDESLAKKVCDKCSCIPLIICVVGKALKFMTRNMWKVTLEKLENCEIERVPGIDLKVYAGLKLSFDNLEEDARLCLLLCSLFPEDAYISVRMLIELGRGSQLVPGGRLTVLAMVDILKSSSLVLVNKSDGNFKLHDIIRDMARSIAIKNYAFLFARSGSRLPHRRLLCLDVNRNGFYLSDDIVYQDIHILWIGSASISREVSQVWEVISMFGNLRFLILRNIDWKQQIPVQQLSKLRAFVLENCDISRLDFKFFSECLETLCIWDGRLPEPLDLLNLKYLRKLEIINRREVELVANTISGLSKLEELHIPNGFKYQQQEDNKFTVNSQLMEISELTRLTSLQMCFKDCERILEPKKEFPDLSEFNIRVGILQTQDSYDSSITRLIGLSGNGLPAAFHSLMERAEVLSLWCTDVNMSSIFNRNKKAFADLFNLKISSCTMEHLARISHHEFHPSLQPRSSFLQLTNLSITNCSAMKYLFCNSVAKCLVQLEVLSVEDCRVMEAIVMNEGITSNGEDIINFKLKSLKLSDMPELKSFYMKKEDMHSTSTTSTLMDSSVAISSFQFWSLFNRHVAFPGLEEMKVKNLGINDIWEKYHYNDNASSFYKLKRLEVSCCTKLETVIPLFMLHKLQNLDYLKIHNCSSVISEVGTYDSNTVVSPLVALTHMCLEELPCLKNTWLNSIDHSQAINLYPKLQTIQIRECNSLRNVFLPSVARDLMHLQILEVDDCEMMTEITGAAAADHQEVTRGTILPKLMMLCLSNLPSLTSFWSKQRGEANDTGKDVFPNLVKCKINYCEEINLEDIEFWSDDTPCKLKSLKIRCHKEIQLPSTWQLGWDNLEILTLGNCWWHELKYPCFSSLKQLEVIKSGRFTLFPLSVFDSLQQLQILIISDCSLLEDIVDDVRRGENIEASSMDKKIIKLFQLKDVTLRNLPNLRSFMSGADYECHMPALQAVEIDNCGLCDLFTSSRYLQQLGRLKVSNCLLLEYVLKDTMDDEISGADDKIIMLPRLLSFSLINLPNLKSFIRNSSYALNIPKLIFLDLIRCPQVENFCSLKTSTGSVSVRSDWHKIGYVYISDLNDYIKQNRAKESNINCDSAVELEEV